MLTPRQQRFVEEYLIDANGHQAALRAGYKPRSARQSVTQLLRNPEVAAALRAAMDARSERLQVHAERVLEELARIAFADIGALAEWGPDGVTLKPASRISADARAAVAEVNTGGGKWGAGPRIRLYSKLRALDIIARHLGLYGKTAPRLPPPQQRAADAQAAREILREKLMQIADAEAARQAEAKK